MTVSHRTYTAGGAWDVFEAAEAAMEVGEFIDGATDAYQVSFAFFSRNCKFKQAGHAMIMMMIFFSLCGIAMCLRMCRQVTCSSLRVGILVTPVLDTGRRREVATLLSAQHEWCASSSSRVKLKANRSCPLCVLCTGVYVCTCTCSRIIPMPRNTVQPRAMR